jgi:solute carrier family 25 (mitochondrial phosphate transporter), member 23/24/25/41
MPLNESGSPLEAALSYYSSVVVTNAEGDSLVSDDALEGLGTTGSLKLLHALFGSIIKLAQPPSLEQTSYTPPSDIKLPTLPAPSSLKPLPATPETKTQPNDRDKQRSDTQSPQGAALSTELLGDITTSSKATAMPAAAAIHGVNGKVATAALASVITHQLGGDSASGPQPAYSSSVKPQGAKQVTKRRLTRYFPEPGYFVAGALAGGISRTATAPLDRLKVYLLVNTKVYVNKSLDAAKHGHPLAAIRNAGKPIGEAIASLYKAGGLRTFFAGKMIPLSYKI